MGQAQPSAEDAIARLLAGYRPPAGVPDELMDPAGRIRPAWRGLLEHLAQHDAREMEVRFARGDQYLRDAGVFFRQYGEGGSTERSWPLSHVPVLIHETEWSAISDALIQRADLLEDVCADLYGENKLVASGHLPASLIAMSPEWLRPLVGVTPRGGKFLHFIAFEIGRGPDGQWWVLGDRVQAPSGAGFALETRVATTRAFSEFYAEANVHRLAGFFRAFRDTLLAMRSDERSRVGILSPGRFTDTYFEHAYIARYLDLMLLEGEDLTVENGQVMVRTIAGLRPVSVLWRRMDAAYVDPLELNETSRLGTPGLVQAIRQGQLAMINALGSGILEMRAMLAFLPRICETLRGEKLAMPNIATWWCGGEAERKHVRANAHRMLISSALSTRMPFDTESAQHGASLQSAPGVVDAMIDAEAAQMVGQEAVTLSTAPAWVNGQLAPRPVSLRIFLARTAQGWRVMPGGYARIGRTEDATAIAMQRGGSVADVWVVSDAPVPAETMLPSPSLPHVRAEHGALPSRAADNLFWMGRYVERAEGLIRLARAYHTRLGETASVASPLLEHIAAAPGFLGLDPSTGAPSALRDMLASATNSAAQVRDRFSVDGWAALADLSSSASRMFEHVEPGFGQVQVLNVLLHKVTGFSGLVHDNMYRFAGWRFLALGRAIERGMAIASALAWFAEPDAPGGSLDFVLEVGDSTLSHRRLYSVTTNRSTIIDLLACDPLNPRSIQYQLNAAKEHIDTLPRAISHGHMSDLARAALKLQSGLAVEKPETLDAAALLAVRSDLAGLSDLLSATYLR